MWLSRAGALFFVKAIATTCSSTLVMSIPSVRFLFDEILFYNPSYVLVYPL